MQAARAPDDLDLAALLQPLPGRVTGDEDRIQIDSLALLRSADQHVWGGSVLRGADGRYHMFVSRFRADLDARPLADEWLLSSEIAHAVSGHPDRVAGQRPRSAAGLPSRPTAAPQPGGLACRGEPGWSAPSRVHRSLCKIPPLPALPSGCGRSAVDAWSGRTAQSMPRIRRSSRSSARARTS
jgi:hypothetical protein